MFTRLNVHLQLNVKASVSVVGNTLPPIVATTTTTHHHATTPFPSFRTSISSIYVLYAKNLLLMMFLFVLHGECAGILMRFLRAWVLERMLGNISVFSYSAHASRNVTSSEVIVLRGNTFNTSSFSSSHHPVFLYATFFQSRPSRLIR